MHYKELRLIVQKVRMTTDLETVKALSLFNNFQTVYFQRNNFKKKLFASPWSLTYLTSTPLASSIISIYTERSADSIVGCFSGQVGPTLPYNFLPGRAVYQTRCKCFKTTNKQTNKYSTD